MARQFEEYSPGVPLGVTWEDQIILQDENGDPVDLTGYAVRAQFYVSRSLRDPNTGAPLTPPVIEIVSEDFYTTLPTWPVIEAVSIPAPTTGTITLRVEVQDLWRFAPRNDKQKYEWSLLLVNPSSGYAIPVVYGKPVFLPAVTI